MNRRSFILSSVALFAISPSTQMAESRQHSAALQKILVQSRRLGPADRTVTFAGRALGDVQGRLALRPLLNGLWIERVSWADAAGAVHRFPVNRNVPRNMQFTFPDMPSARRIDIDLTCLPLAVQQTVVEFALKAVMASSKSL